MFHYPPSKPYTQTPDDGKSAPPPTGRDRGPAAFFHGRNDIITSFETALSDTINLNAGTTFLIQGAPGAGKTALLHECENRAVKKWKIADIYPNALWSPDDLIDCLGKSRGLITSWVEKLRRGQAISDMLAFL